MSRKPVLWVSAALTLTLTLGAFNLAKCRADEFDDKLKQFQKQRAGEAVALQAEVKDALTKAPALAHSSPAKAEKLLRPLLTRLLDDTQLPQEERLAFLRQLKGQLDGFQELVAEEPQKQVAHEQPQPAPATLGETKSGHASDWAAKPATSADSPSKTAKSAQPKGQGLGNVTLGPITPVVSADRRFVRVGISGTFFFPNVNNSYVPIQTAIPTILYNGPPTGVSIGAPVNIFRVWVRQPQANPISIQSGGILIFP
ncbi:MAG TPA: hypothetical protein VEL76_42405 [Gemmataceae bacterium]|nr:hypothetical protein [Gemmataceae bacterium]